MPTDAATAAHSASSLPDQPEAFSHFDLASMAKSDVYKLLTSVVVPRPIAWVVSRDLQGSVNAAPFSFFNMLSSDPPLLAISFAAASDRDGKDTLHNIRQRGEFVVNMVSEELLNEMHITAASAPRGTDETQLAGLRLVDSDSVGVPRIAASPVALECQLFQILEPGPATTIVLGRILRAHVREAAIANPERMHIDSGSLHLVGRMQGGEGGYCTTRETFQLPARTELANAEQTGSR